MPNMSSDEKKKKLKTHTHIQRHVYIYKKGERTTSKFKTTKLPMIHAYTHIKSC